MNRELFEVCRNDPYHAFDAARAKIAELQQRVAVQRRMNATLLQDPQYQYGRAVRDFEKLKRDHIALNDQYNDLEAVNETLQEVIEVLRGDKHQLLVELSALKRELMIQSIENDLLEQKARQVSAFNENLDLKLASQEAQLTSLEEDEKAARANIAQLTNDITALESSCQNLSLQSTSLSDLRQHLETTRVAQDRAIQALEREVQGKVQEVVEHDAQLWEFKREMSGRVLALQKKAQECADEFGRLQRLSEHEMATLASQNHALNDELTATADTLFATRKEKADFSNAAKKELAQRREEIQQCLSVIDLVERQNQGLEAAIARLMEQNKLSERQIIERDAGNHKNLIEQSNFMSMLHMELQTTREDLFLLKARLCHHCRETILADEVADDRLAVQQLQQQQLASQRAQADQMAIAPNVSGMPDGSGGPGAMSDADKQRYEGELRRTREALEAVNRQLLEERAQHERERREQEEMQQQEEEERMARQMEEDARRRRNREDERKVAAGEEAKTFTVRFMDGSRKKVDAFLSDTVGELLQRVCTKVGIRQTDFLHIAHSVNENTVLGAVDRFLDKHKTLEQEGINPKCNLVLKFKHYKRHRRWADTVAQEWYFRQIHQNVVREYYPVTEKLAVELASYEIQAVFGDYSGKKRHAYFDRVGLDSYLPVSVSAHDYEYWQERLFQLHKKRKGLSTIDARNRYIETFATKSPHWGMTFFDVRDRNEQPFLAGIAEDGLYLLSASKGDVLVSMPFHKLAGWERSPSGIFVKQRGNSKMTLLASSKLQSKEMCDLLNEYYMLLPQTVRDNLGIVIENAEELRARLPPPELFAVPVSDRRRPVEFYSRLEYLKTAYMDHCHRGSAEDGTAHRPIAKFTQAIDRALDEDRNLEDIDLSHSDIDNTQVAVIRELFFHTLDQVVPQDVDQFKDNIVPKKISFAHTAQRNKLSENCVANVCDLLKKFHATLTFVDLSSIPLDRSEVDIGDALVTLRNIDTLVLRNCKIQPKTFQSILNVFSIVPSQLRTLDLEQNFLTHASVLQVCGAMEGDNCSLTNLNIGYNKVEAGGIEAIITSLKRKRRLKTLDYSGNSAPASKFAELVAANVGLTELNISKLQLTGDGAVRIAAELKSRGELLKLNLSHNDIGKTLLRERQRGSGEVSRDYPAEFFAFLDVSSYSNIRELIMEECELHEDAGLALAGVLQSNAKLTELILTNNRLCTKSGVLPGTWYDMFPINQHLQKLHLGGNGLSYPGIMKLFLAMARNKSITELNLDSNNFDRYPPNASHSEVVTFLENNTTVTHLSLVNMYMRDDILRKVGEGLRLNRSLRTLIAHNNEITYAGVGDLARCLQENNTLQVMDLSCASVQASEEHYMQAYKNLIDMSNLETVLL
jgi:hypothetical protein